MKMNRLCSALIMCGAIVSAPAFAAGSVSTTMNVSGTVIGTCAISANTLSFGTAIPADITANIDPNSVNLTATCASGTVYTVALSAGSGSGATFAARKLTSGSNQVNYTIYTDAGRTTVWGDGTGTSATVTGTGNGAAQTIPVYGRIQSGQT